VLDCAMPALAKSVHDRSPAVRHTLARLLSFLLRARPERSEGVAQLGLEPLLLFLLLCLTRDETDEVQRAAHECLAAAGAHWHERLTPSHDEGACQAVEAAVSFRTLPSPPPSDASTDIQEAESASLASDAVRGMVVYHLPAMMGHALESVGHWTVAERVRGFSCLAFIVRVVRGVQSAIAPSLPRVVDAIASAVVDDEQAVVEAARRCARALGGSSAFDLTLELVLPRMRGEGAGMDTADHRKAAALLVASLVEDGAAPVDSVAFALPAIAVALADPGLLSQGAESDKALMDAGLADALFEVVDSLVSKEGLWKALPNPAAQDTQCMILRVCMQLLAAPAASVTEGLAEDVEEVMGELAARQDMTTEDLLLTHLPQLLNMVLQTPGPGSNASVSSGGTWPTHSPARRAFDALLRRGASSLVRANQLDSALPVITQHLHEKMEPDLKLAMLCLLQTLLSTPELAEGWPKHAQAIIQAALTHNMVWRAGRVASTVRKVAIACLYELLRHGYADPPCLFATAPPLLPILKTDLDDYDASTRELVCLCLERLFICLPKAFGEQPILELYPALLKRLDDSSDQVRLAVCSTMVPFFSAATPKAYQGTCIDYTLDQLFVHLDDNDLRVQQAVLAVIKAATPIDAKRVIKKAEDSRLAHRSTKLLDEVVELARSHGGEGREADADAGAGSS